VPAFKGVEIYVWAKLAGSDLTGGHAAPHDGLPGGVWLEALSVNCNEDPALLVAHEIGHFLGLKHPCRRSAVNDGCQPEEVCDPQDRRLMHPAFRGPNLTEEDIEQANNAVTKLLENSN
jgi:hypothetical protein